jgi:catalase
VPRLVGSRLGKITAAKGATLDIEITFEAGPSVLYDGVIIIQGERSILQQDKDAIDFIRQQYRHCKPIFSVGSRLFLSEEEILTTLPDGTNDPAVIIDEQELQRESLIKFKAALADHRFCARETE